MRTHNFSNPLSRGEIFEYAKNPEKCGRSRYMNFLSNDAAKSLCLRFCSDCDILILVKAKEAKKEGSSGRSDEFAAIFAHVISFAHTLHVANVHREVWIRVDGQIFKSTTKYLRIKKTSGYVRVLSNSEF